MKSQDQHVGEEENDSGNELSEIDIGSKWLTDSE